MHLGIAYTIQEYQFRLDAANSHTVVTVHTYTI